MVTLKIKKNNIFKERTARRASKDLVKLSVGIKAATVTEQFSY